MRDAAHPACDCADACAAARAIFAVQHGAYCRADGGARRCSAGRARSNTDLLSVLAAFNEIALIGRSIDTLRVYDRITQQRTSTAR